MTTRQSAARCGLALCEVCGQMSPLPSGQTPTRAKPRCARCRSPLHLRKPDSINRTWALLIAAYLLYLPANLLPIMETHSPFGTDEDTILSGIIFLWQSGSWLLALIVFSASIVLPLVKLLSLTYLLWTVKRSPTRNPLGRARLYRLLELIGRWSMLDVYVVTLLVALVQVQSLASISPGAGVVAFGAVVVLSMLATMAFDPRLIWDRAAERITQESPHA